MRIFDETKTKEISNPNTEKGYLQSDKLFIKHYNAVEEQGHYETIKEYENGGKDVEWVVDIEGVEEHDEYEDILVYIPYTEKQLAEMHIGELKQKLADTDYQAIKYAEGELTDEEYAPMKAQRKVWRKEINELEEKTETLTKN